MNLGKLLVLLGVRTFLIYLLIRNVRNLFDLTIYFGFSFTTRHIMHGLCSEGIGNSTRLAKCPRDFVEAPSQMLENWCWQKSILERLSKHYQSGKCLPDEMLQSMIKAKHVNVAFASLRQIYLSRLDLTIHGLDPPKDADGLQALVDKLRPQITLIENPSGNNMLRTFGHLMNQYSASYVS